MDNIVAGGVLLLPVLVLFSVCLFIIVLGLLKICYVQPFGRTETSYTLM